MKLYIASAKRQELNKVAFATTNITQISVRTVPIATIGYMLHRILYKTH